VYLITYQKKNGDIIYRERATLPGIVGSETSMGWIIQDIKYQFNNKYYDYVDYKNISKKYYAKRHIFRQAIQYVKRYSATVIIIVLVPLYLFK